MKIEFFYPGFVKKAITFSIDDGSLEMDKKFMSILAPHGITGTFNLCNVKKLEDPAYRVFYENYGIANHCQGHPMVFAIDKTYQFSKEPLNETNGKEELLYPTDDPRVFRCYPHTWRTYTDRDTYYELSEQSREALLAAFGASAAKDFVWPHGQQNDPALHAMLKKRYRSIRKTGSLRDSTGFSLPADLHAWTYNAVHDNLLDVAALYEAYPDDGELKFFSIGVHSVDYESAGKWEDLRLFAERMGDRPNVYYYASVNDIFDYAEAVKSVFLSDSYIENTSSISVFLSVNGERRMLAAGEKIAF